MKKQNENHQYKSEIKTTHDIRNMTNYIEWSVMRMIALFIYQKKKEYFSKASKNYREKKKTRWAIWNAERAKISHQINKFSEKSDDKSKLLKIKQKKKQIKQTKITSFWWKQKIIYNSESIAQWFTLMKNSEKHHKSEKSKKNQLKNCH